MTTALVYDAAYLRHETGWGHPERPERLSLTYDHLLRQPWFPSLKLLKPRIAEEEWILSTHTREYAERVRAGCAAGQTALDTPDVGISADSFNTARLAAGGALTIADAVMSGDLHNGFALIRPPGHHAESERAMGFCLFNNAAILARYLQKRHGLGKILILDWDVHHGNGTQHAFEEDPSVYYMSLHQYPFYPGTGGPYETGRGRGEGSTLNCPMGAGARDEDYEEAFRTRILPQAEAFRPEAVLISAGFDAHEADPLGSICLTTEFFGWMTERMMEVAGRFAGGRLISLLEGGYHPEYLPRCTAEHLRVLSGSDSGGSPQT
ncbi:MAG: histone deacetylase [Candidatus Omnitrophica bacterium]|nr:histone deacetylase [Candidatus Omnitrophota bacterium]